MKSISRRAFASAAIAFAVAAFPASAVFAQAYPARNIRLIVPFVAGGPTDALARVIGEAMSTTLGQPVVIENRGGAGGRTAMEVTANSAPDGYTLFFATTGTMSINPSLYKMPDPLKVLEPISTVASSSNVLVVRPDFPASTIGELIALAKQKPGTLTFGSAGIGATTHLAGELLKSAAGINIVHVPYKGTAAAMTDLLGGQISMAFDTISGSVIQYINGKQLKAIAVTGETRNDMLPTVPTVAQSGLPGFEVTTWYGLAAPAGTPAAIVERLSADMKKILAMREVRDKLASFGVTPFPGDTPKAFAELIRSDAAKWNKVIATAGITAN